jgi:hypothetical protein
MLKINFLVVFLSFFLNLQGQREIQFDKVVVPESYPGAYDAELIIKMKNVGYEANQYNPPFNCRLCFNNINENCFRITNFTDEIHYKNLRSGFYMLYVTDANYEHHSIIEEIRLCPQKLYSEFKTLEPLKGPLLIQGSVSYKLIAKETIYNGWNIEDFTNNNIQYGKGTPILDLPPYYKPYRFNIYDDEGCKYSQEFMIIDRLPIWRTRDLKFPIFQKPDASEGIMEVMILPVKAYSNLPISVTFAPNGYKNTTQQLNLNTKILNNVCARQDSMLRFLINLIEDSTAIDDLKIEAVYLLSKVNNDIATNFILKNIDNKFNVNTNDSQTSFENAVLQWNKWEVLLRVFEVLRKDAHSKEQIIRFSNCISIKFQGQKEVAIAIIDDFMKNYEHSWHSEDVKVLVEILKK